MDIQVVHIQTLVGGGGFVLPERVQQVFEATIAEMSERSKRRQQETSLLEAIFALLTSCARKFPDCVEDLCNVLKQATGVQFI